MSGIDNIISSFENLLNGTNTNSIDNLINQINQIEINTEYSELISNYNKLKYFKNFIGNELVEKPFWLFMEKIDSMNQYYLQNINFNPLEYNQYNQYN